MQKCIICSNDILNVNTKKFPKIFCSYSCYEHHSKFTKEPNCECVVCNKKIYMKPHRLKRLKNKITCSKKCNNIYKKFIFKGKNNHQFGLKGPLNSSFKGKMIKRINHKNIDLMIYIPTHPYADSCGRVVYHRYVVEENYEKFDICYFDNINGKYYLKKGLDVHHIDHDHNNNDISNLQILTRKEHLKLHNTSKSLIRNPLNGRIIGVLKLGEFRENPEVDNPELSINLND